MDGCLDQERRADARQTNPVSEAGRKVLRQARPTLDDVRRRFAQGLVIPAHPLALTAERRLDERSQRALTRYYLAAGAGGLAIGVHTTQFAIRDPKVGLLAPVLELGLETVRERGTAPLLVAGVCGRRTQASREAELAADLGYDAGLVSLAGFDGATDAELVEHCRAIAQTLPLVGFYLQPAVGGRVLGLGFWREFAEIEQVVAIKIAPFNRYQTLDVVRAVVEVGRAGDIALYTGNDDNIVFDLLAEYRLAGMSPRIVGGLLGQWAVGTRRAVELLDQIRRWRGGGQVPVHALAIAHAITDLNAALFDAANHFAGCIPGINELLRRQGLMGGRWCLDPAEELSPGQLEEIDRVHHAYPELHDDEFIAQHRDEWLR